MKKKKENNITDKKEGFRIVCDICGRQLCNFQFTENGDVVVYCRSCTQAKIICKEYGGIKGRDYI